MPEGSGQAHLPSSPLEVGLPEHPISGRFKNGAQDILGIVCEVLPTRATISSPTCIDRLTKPT